MNKPLNTDHFPKLSKKSLFNKQLFDKIRSRLKLSKKDLPDAKIRKYYKYLNSSLLDFILDNPEGFQMTIGNQLNGVFAVSKHLPKEMREDKFQKLEEIENNPNIPEYLKKVYRKRYATALNRRVQWDSLKKDELQYHVNAHSFFYSYRIMWFNHRNCKSRRAITYIFEAAKKAKTDLEYKVRNGIDYNEYNFNDFYRFRIRPII